MHAELVIDESPMWKFKICMPEAAEGSVKKEKPALLRIASW